MRLNNTGHTLTETIMSMAIFTIIIAGIYSTLYVGNISWAVQDVSVNVQSQARRVIGRMTQDLRVGQNIVITQDADNVAIALTRSGSAITYSWTTDAGSTQNQLIRAVDGTAVVVAADISALSLTETASDVKIDLTISAQSNLKQTMNYSLVGNVAKRY